MFAAGERPFFLREISRYIYFSLFACGRSVRHAHRDLPFPVPFRAGTQSFSAERSVPEKNRPLVPLGCTLSFGLSKYSDPCLAWKPIYVVHWWHHQPPMARNIEIAWSELGGMHAPIVKKDAKRPGRTQGAPAAFTYPFQSQSHI